MTWHMSSGDRVLQGAEAWLFAKSILMMTDLLEPEDLDICPVGVKPFDLLTDEQKIAALYEVARAMLLRSVPSPALHAYQEATVAVVLQTIPRFLDEPELVCTNVGANLVALTKEAFRDCYGTEPVDMETGEPYGWRLCVDALEEAILWDRDYDMGDILLDKSSADARQLMTYAGIDSNSYRAIPEDPTAERAWNLVEDLRRVCKRVIRKAQKERR